MLPERTKTVAVIYLVRGATADWRAAGQRFLESYRRNAPGCAHELHVVFTAFEGATDLQAAKNLFLDVEHSPVVLDGRRSDIGAYAELANTLAAELLCGFDGASEILAADWLYKLAVNLQTPNVGLVGATASFERPGGSTGVAPAFPNVHIRSNAFMIERVLFCRISRGLALADESVDASFENGPDCQTRRVLATGRDVLLVGRNGRGYPPKFWATSDTFRQGRQGNLLVADEQTRTFEAAPWSAKRALANRTWGKYLGQ